MLSIGLSHIINYLLLLILVLFWFVILKCSHLLDKNKGNDFSHASLKDLLLDLFDIVPDTAHRFLRVSVLRPENVLEILLGFQYESGKLGLKLERLSLCGKFSSGLMNRIIVLSICKCKNEHASQVQVQE